MAKTFVNMNGQLYVQMLTENPTVGDIIARPATKAEKQTRRAAIEAQKNAPNLAAEAAMKKELEHDAKIKARAEEKAKRRAEEAERRELREIRDQLKKLEREEAAEAEKEVIETEEQAKAVLAEAKVPANVRDELMIAFELDELAEIVHNNNIAELTKVNGVANARAKTIIDALKGRLLSYSEKRYNALREPDDHQYNVAEYTIVWDKKTRTAKLVKTGVNKKRFGPAGIKAQALSGKETPFFTVISKIDPKLDDYAKSAIQKFLNNATHVGIHFKGSDTLYGPGIMGTNALMRNMVHYCNSKIIRELREWQFCGAKLTSEQKMAKLAAYGGLLLPYTHELMNGVLKPEMEALIPAWNNEIELKNKLYQPDGSIIDRLKTIICQFDGMAIFEMTPELKKKLGLNRKELRRLERTIAKFNGGTLRAPWQKGLIVTKVHFHDMLKELGVFTIGGKPIEDIAIFGDEKVFKAAIGEGKNYEDWSEYCAKFDELKHRFGLLLENHGVKSTFLPSQQLNAVVGGDIEHIREGVKQEVNYLREASIPKVAIERYGNKLVSTIGAVDEDITKVWFVQEMLNSQYQTERKTSLSGRSHSENYAGFVCADIGAFGQWIAYCEGVRKELPTGFLKDMTVYAPMARPGTAILSRNPVVALYGLPEVEVVTSLGEYDKYFEENFPFIMVPIGKASILLRMDFDGDKARLSFADWFVKLVRSAKKNAGEDIEVIADWEGFGEAYKAIPDDEAFAKTYASATASSALGMNVSAYTKVAQHWHGGDVAELQRTADYMMNKGTDVKQGADGSTADGQIGEDWGKIWNESQKLNFTRAHAMAKELKRKQDEEPVDPKKVDKDWSMSPADCFNSGVSMLTAGELNFGASAEKSWEFMYKVLANGLVRIPGLCGWSKWNEEKGEYEDPSLFIQLVLRHTAEWKELCEDDKTRYNWADWKAWKREEAWKELVEYGKEKGFTEADVYDAITGWVYGTLANKWFKQDTIDKNGVLRPGTSEKQKKFMMVIARQYIEWFGDINIEMYQLNAGKIVEIKPGNAAECDDEDPCA